MDIMFEYSCSSMCSARSIFINFFMSFYSLLNCFIYMQDLYENNRVMGEKRKCSHVHSKVSVKSEVVMEVGEIKSNLRKKTSSQMHCSTSSESLSRTVDELIILPEHRVLFFAWQ